MSLSDVGATRDFQHYIQGLFGSFATPAGRVDYIMTKARIGAEDTDPERRLTEHLVPFREVIPAEHLDFNQLLQRDLDDHRVAVNLVPYLLQPSWNGPAFFPPIVAIILPFDRKRPAEFPPLGAPERAEADAMTWIQQDAASHLRIRRLATKGGDLSPIPLGQLWWNSEFCQIVVVDGQHRAMALLAIDRTARATWDKGSGTQYKFFYEDRVKELLKARNGQIDDIEVPVVVLWFPDKFGSGSQPHNAARKLFVDVNKEARTPSESRLILLSDSELVNVFTRSALMQLRNESEEGYIPLYCVEYDNPDTKRTQSARWSVLTNIHTFKQMVNRCVFGPPKYVFKVDIPISGAESEEERDGFMRKQIRVERLFDPEIETSGEPFQRNDLGNVRFPEEALGRLEDGFKQTWGVALVTLISEVEPYRAHAAALNKLKKNWIQGNAISSLAHDALFSGVGMYWTLRDSAQHWKEEEGGQGSRPDVVKAWEVIAQKQAEFEELRAEELLGSKSKKSQANSVYQVMNTQACQLGLALTLATIVYDNPEKAEPVDLARAIAEGVNSWMLSKVDGDYDRRLAFAKRVNNKPKYPLNIISNMDTPRAVQFRYFWLEILASDEAAVKVKQLVDLAKLRKRRDEARAFYISYVASEKARALKTSEPELSEGQRKRKSREQAAREVRSALLKWFGFSSEELKPWFDTFEGGDRALDMAETEIEDAQGLDEEAIADA